MHSQNRQLELLDVVFIGGGVSSSYTLLALIEELRAGVAGRAVRSAVVEQSGPEYGGVPYGSRSGPVSLIITALQDFLPEPERSDFVAWIVANKQSLLDDLATGGAQAKRWLLDNREAIAADDWLPLYVPRRFFGRYMDERVRREVASAEADGVLQHSIVHATAVSVTGADSEYRVSLSDGDQLLARSVVIGIGSMPLQRRFPTSSNDGACLVDDLYVPGLPANIESIRASIGPDGEPARILILGSNASALETLYVLNDRDDPGLRRARFTVMSPGGAFPERTVPPRDVDVPTQHLDKLASTDDDFTAVDLYEAARRDLAAIHTAGITVTESLAVTGRLIGGLVARLSVEDKRAFAGTWGVQLGKYQRRAGGEYSDNVEQLRALGRLEMVPAAFTGIHDLTADGARVSYVQSGAEKVSTDRFQAIVNCAGFSSMLAEPESPLVRSLLSSGLCRGVPTGCGFEVNDRMEAAPRIFVMGPLLAGNVVNGQAIWHVEHCGRISQFSQALGRTLAEELLAELGGGSL